MSRLPAGAETGAAAPIALSEPLYSQAYDRIWAALIAGDLQAGARLKDGEWAERLGISRTPVREAFRKLMQDGAIDPLSSVGFRVHEFTADEILGLYRCRAALEAVVAEEAAAERSPTLLDALAENIEAAEHALHIDDLEALQRLNSAFHRILLETGGNPHLRRLLEQTGRSVQMARRQVLRRANEGSECKADYRRSLQAVLDDHRALLKAVASGDTALAGSMMRDHLMDTARDMAVTLKLARHPG